MRMFFIPDETDFKRWMKEAIKDYFEGTSVHSNQPNTSERFLSRKEVAGMLQISLVTLTEWVKLGLPSHKFQGRVFFLYSEVMEYIKASKLKRMRRIRK